MSVPSRHSNPFATCWVRPQAMPYLVTTGQTPQQLVHRLALQEWTGEIVGPHGSGKSTLLATLEPLVAAAGKNWQRVDLRQAASQRCHVRALREISLDPEILLVVDGFEQLSRPARQWVRWRCRRQGAGLLATSHRASGLPTLASLRPEFDVALALFHRLILGVETPVSEADLQSAFNACRGNLRDVFFDLYDRHERRTRRRWAVNRPAAGGVQNLIPALKN